MENKLSRYDRDTEYWNDYYRSVEATATEPSKFAKDILKYLQSGKKMLELGCGNGRDTIFFADNGMNVTGIDASNFAITALSERYENKNLHFICDDFVSSKILFEEKFDYCYARFVLHAITGEQEEILLRNIGNVLNEGGIFFIEARTIHDDIYGKGTRVGRHEFLYNNHYRRFIDAKEIEKNIKNSGVFKILYMEEGKDFAPTENSNPTLLRIIVKR